MKRFLPDGISYAAPPVWRISIARNGDVCVRHRGLWDWMTVGIVLALVGTGCFLYWASGHLQHKVPEKFRDFLIIVPAAIGLGYAMYSMWSSRAFPTIIFGFNDQQVAVGATTHSLVDGEVLLMRGYSRGDKWGKGHFSNAGKLQLGSGAREKSAICLCIKGIPNPIALVGEMGVNQSKALLGLLESRGVRTRIVVID